MKKSASSEGPAIIPVTTAITDRPPDRWTRLRLALAGDRVSRERWRRIVSRKRDVAVTAIVDADLMRTDGCAPQPASEIRVRSLEELLSRHAAAIDAVLFLSAEAFSASGCAQTARAGKHIFCDSSLPVSRATVGQVVDACRNAGVRLMIGPRRRFAPALRTVKESLDAGRLGLPGLLRIHRWRPRATDPRPPLDSTGDARIQPLLDQLVGEIDLACWLFGRRPSVVFAVASQAITSPHDASRQAGDYLQLHLGFADGGMALVDLAHTLPAGNPYDSLSLIGSTGAAYADDHHNTQLIYGGGPPAALLTGAGEAEAVSQWHEFFSAITTGREPSPSGEQLLLAFEVAAAAAVALDTRHAVPMPGDP